MAARRVPVMAAVALATALWSSAQEPGPEADVSFFQPIRVPLVDIQVVVTDAEGAPVIDLQREDFEVFEDGAPVEISHFAREVHAAGTHSSAGAPVLRPPSWSRLSGPGEGSFLVLYFDDSNTDPRRRTSVLEHLQQQLDEIRRAGVETMVVRFDGTLHLESDFSDPPERAVDALVRIRQRPAFDPSREANDLIRDMESAVTTSRLLNAVQQEINNSQQGGGRGGPSPMAAAITDFGPRIDAYARSSNARNRATLGGLRQVVSMLRGIRGRKAVLWVGNLETRAGEELYGAWEGLFPGGSGQSGGSAMMGTLPYDLSTELTEVADYASAHMISFYPVRSIAGSAASQISPESRRGLTPANAARHAGRNPWSGQDARDALAILTGGRPLRGGRNLETELLKLSVELGTYYSLAFSPGPSSREGFHEIAVNVNRDGLIVRHRHGHQGLGERARMVDRLAAAAMVGVSDNPLGVEIESQTPEPRGDDSSLVPVVIRIPIGDLSLIPEAGAHRAHVSLFSLVRDERGGLSEVSERSYPLDIPNDELGVAVGQQAKFVLGLVLRHGRHRVAVGIRDDRSLTASTVFLDVEAGPSVGDASG